MTEPINPRNRCWKCGGQLTAAQMCDRCWPAEPPKPILPERKRRKPTKQYRRKKRRI